MRLWCEEQLKPAGQVGGTWLGDSWSEIDTEEVVYPVEHKDPWRSRWVFKGAQEYVSFIAKRKQLFDHAKEQ